MLILSLSQLGGAFAQINLVVNPSFEILDSCPTYLNQIAYAENWFQPYITSTGSQNSSTDLYSICCTSIYCSVPNNFLGTQLPKTGNSYSGIILYSQPSSHEYIETMLDDTLITGKSYCIQFYISLSDNSKYAVSNIGAYFSSDSCLSIIPPFILTYIPQIKNTDTIIVKDKTNWQRISLNYLADGGEEFITIGNFDADNLSHISNVGGTKLNAYYYIDDVSVIDISTPAYAGNDTTILTGDSVFIGRPPEIGLDEDCIWYVNNQPIDTVAGLWVRPEVSTTYVLQQTICGTVTYDTVKINVSGVGVNEEKITDFKLQIHPNPVKEKLIIENRQLIGEEATITIYDVLGNIVIQLKNYDTSQGIDMSGISEGVYFIQVYTKDKMYTSKFVKE